MIEGPKRMDHQKRTRTQKYRRVKTTSANDNEVNSNCQIARSITNVIGSTNMKNEYNHTKVNKLIKRIQTT